MNEERMMQILRRPHISEKATTVGETHRQVVFEVDTTATKGEVKEAVEKMFEVQVENVTVSNVRGKMKRFGRTPGKRQNWKKAYVTLKEGNDIDFIGSGS
jgi:large subunit ribosomal protein L23